MKGGVLPVDFVLLSCFGSCLRGLYAAAEFYLKANEVREVLLHDDLTNCLHPFLQSNLLLKPALHHSLQTSQVHDGLLLGRLDAIVNVDALANAVVTEVNDLLTLTAGMLKHVAILAINSGSCLDIHICVVSR